MKNTFSENIDKKVPEEEKPAKKVVKKSGRSKAVVQILNGDFFSREFVIENLGFIFYIMLLLLLIVGKGYYVKQLSDEIVATDKSLDETVSDYVEMKVKFEENNMRGNLLEELDGTGLVESIEPPKVIRIKKKKK
jgi:hypothetical protein